MSTINIKIVGFDEGAGTILVKFVSDKSKKSIDEYPAIGYPITNISEITPQTFIDSIKQQVSNYVYVRDVVEEKLSNVNLAIWNEYEATFTGTEYVDPFLTSQIVEGLNNPEVTL